MIYSPSQTKTQKVVTACVKCNKRPSEVGKTRCLKCSEWNKKSMARVRARKIAAGICLCCGKAPAEKPLKRCRPCLNKLSRTTSEAKRIKTYGITDAQRDEMFRKQGGFCAFCGLPLSATKMYHIDHCHISGKVRGLLHNDCNLLLGFYEKIGPRFFDCVKQYLGGL